jgi:quercetin dioxygenase-like cupin family protein
MAEDDWPWPDGLDAVCAAPEQHLLLLENENIRVLEARVAAGETVPLHTHRWPAALYFVSWSDCVRRDETGAITKDSRLTQTIKDGDVLWSPPLGPHTLENVGGRELRVIVIEQKTASAGGLEPS